ncbi:MAG: hypothetical protein K0R18_2556 [Bacillales bacterium]|jgi:hypothetical protein|nr:hypothetical protein [Bacillales bacterium]
MTKGIVEETIDSLLEFMPKVISTSKNTAELFHSEREAMALTNMIEIIDAYAWIIDAVNGMQKNGFLLEFDLVEMTDLLSQIEQAMKTQDFALVSDILDYEVTEVLEKWHTQLSKESGILN